MKKILLVMVLGFISTLAFSQSKSKAKIDRSHIKVDTIRIVNVKLNPDAKIQIDTTNGFARVTVPPNTVTFVMTPEQVQLLEYVISESGAGFKSTNQCIAIMKSQQYVNPPFPVPKSDTSSKK